ncbi:MAG: N-acyl homoserine lactonase family protein [Acidimicrobiia bacterium]|nr:N-acyl homoserine lactonase family protein [Acidimicrobiia bacterium]MDH5291267.1 N-acyl homoserine lactonase family protein [Acidimicrobiia bacterium]
MTVRVRLLTCGWLEGSLSMLMVGGQGRVRLPIPSVLVEHPKGSAVFDTGLHASLAHDTSRLRSSNDLFDVFMDADDALGPQLRALDVDPSGVDVVINSHLHFDHCGGNEALANATLLVQDPEWKAGHIDKLIERDVYNPSDFDLGQPVQLLQGEHDVFGDGSVRCVPTYGHTAGHQSLVVRTDNAEYVFCGDTCYFKETLENNALPGFGYDLAAQARTLDWLREMQSAGAQLVFGHDPNQWPTLGPELA